MSFEVKFLDLVRGTIGMCGLDRAGILRLYERVHRALAEAPEAIRAKRSLKRPDCFIFKAAMAGVDANYWFHFLVKDQAEPGKLTVVHVFAEQRPRDED